MAQISVHIRRWGSGEQEANLVGQLISLLDDTKIYIYIIYTFLKGQCFIAINPGNFADNFEERLQSLMNHCRNSNPVEADKPVLVAGDPERTHMEQCDKNEGISYHENQIKYVENLAKELNVTPPKYRPLV